MIALGIAALSSDDLSQVVFVVATSGLVIAILATANAATRRESWAVGAYAMLIGLCAIVSIFAGIELLALLGPHSGPASGPRAAYGLAILFASGPVSALGLHPRVRRAIGGRLRGFDAESPVHAVSLGLYTLALLFQVGNQVMVDQLQSLGQPGPAPSLAFILLTNQLPFVVVSFFGVGLLTRRVLPAVLRRLGLYWPGWRWIAAGLGVAVGLLIFGTFFEEVMRRATPHDYTSIQKVSGQLLKNVNGIMPALILSVGAGIGEEVLFRGALVPRFGVIAAALLFAAFHTQYGVTLATLEIFILGVVLGILRKRAGTVPAIVAHAGYDGLVQLIPLLFGH